MNTLFINSTLSILHISLLIDDEYYSIKIPSKQSHNECILSAIDSVLNDAKINISNIDKIICIKGPGSFTGIRVGLATAMGLAMPNNIQTAGINNLEYLYQLSRIQGYDNVVCVIYGSRDSYFAAIGNNGTLDICQYNMTHNQLMQYISNEKVVMFCDEYIADFDVEYIDTEDKVKIFLQNVCNDNGDMVPVYYQLSQAENGKINNMYIVQATARDIDKMVSIDRLCFKKSWGSEVFVDEMKNNRKIYIAYIDDNAVGYIDIYPYPDEDNIMRIAVLPTYQRKGIASRLINYAMDNTSQCVISLEVSAKNTSALMCYEKMGFNVRRVRKNYYDDADGIEMTKTK